MKNKLIQFSPLDVSIPEIKINATFWPWTAKIFKYYNIFNRIDIFVHLHYICITINILWANGKILD